MTKQELKDKLGAAVDEYAESDGVITQEEFDQKVAEVRKPLEDHISEMELADVDEKATLKKFQEAFDQIKQIVGSGVAPTT